MRLEFPFQAPLQFYGILKPLYYSGHLSSACDHATQQTYDPGAADWGSIPPSTNQIQLYLATHHKFRGHYIHRNYALS